MNLPKAGDLISPTSKGPISLDMLKLYAKASGDHNPIHVDETVAKQAGLPGIIAHGMLTAGFLSSRAAEVTKSWDGEWKVSCFQARFKAMTFLGNIVTITGAFKTVETDSIFVELTATNPKGEVTTQANVEFRRMT